MASATGFGRAARALRSARVPDGGFGPRPEMPSEPEPTALAALALDDAPARAWLSLHQRPSGALSFAAGEVVNDAATGLAAIAMGPGPARERALDHLVRARAPGARSAPNAPHDPRYRGWAWTEGTFGWVEPTAHALLALRLLRPRARAPIADGVGVLRTREAVGGGWNSGNRTVFEVDLPAFGQTTAVALVALRGLHAPLEARGLDALRRLWREEREGPLTLATATAALRLHGDADAHAAGAELAREIVAMERDGDVVSLAWAALALGPGLRRLEST